MKYRITHEKNGWYWREEGYGLCGPHRDRLSACSSLCRTVADRTEGKRRSVRLDVAVSLGLCDVDGNKLAAIFARHA